MFKKTKYKITFSINIFLILLIILGTFLSIFNIQKEMRNNFINDVSDSIELSVANCKLNITTAINATNTIVEQNINIDIKTLNSIKQTALCIAGAAYYQIDGNVIFSDGMSNVPTLAALSNHDTIKANLENDEVTHFFSIRSTTIAGYYSATAYDSSYGIISYVVKIFDNYNLVGYLFVDISTVFVYKTFFTYDDYPNFTEHASFITYNSIPYFKYRNNNNYDTYLNEQVDNKTIISSDNKYIINNHYIDEIDSSLTIVVGLKYHHQKVFQTLLPIIVFSCFMICISIGISLYISKKIISSLIKLNNKMASTTIDTNTIKE